ncbi:MAG TPA: SUMF1/EgtB/PvdO family nonheme iron enzyme [Planctomycetota bacterium]|jgi:formylglycine-generating enzyme required for sulfatase activity/serine/threonine protein kinase
MAETRKIGNFELLERIGQGGMGAVFKARQISMDRIVALKILPPQLARQPGFIERFTREARACARLSHPNIVGGIDVGEAGGVYYFAMEFVEGSSAKHLIRPGGAPEEQVLKIGKAIADALAHAHNHGILHRDIKPDNILIDKDGTPKLCDLGLARLESQNENEKSLTQDGTALGTPDYISPEQARGQRDLDVKTDLYSLGATLYHLLTGKPMFEGATTAVIMTKHLTSKSQSPYDVGVQASKGMVTILAKLLAKDRTDRYESAEKLSEDLERVAQGQPPQYAALPLAKWPFAGNPLALPTRKVTAAHDATRSSQRSTAPASTEVKSASAGRWLLPVGAVCVCIVVLMLVLGRKEQRPEATAENDLKAASAPAPVQQPVPPPKKPAVATDEAKRRFEAAEDFAKKNPANVAAAIAEYEKARASARGTEFERKAADAIEKLNKGREQAAAGAALKLATEANALAAQDKYDSAIALWEKVPAEQADLLGRRVAKAAVELRAQAEAKLKTFTETAEKCLNEKRWEDGKKALDAAVKVEYEEQAPRIRSLRDKLAAAEQAEAENKRNANLAGAEAAFAGYLDAFVPATLKGDHKAARKIAAEAKTDAALKDLASKVQELTAVCDALDKADSAALAVLRALEGKENSFETTNKGTKKGLVVAATSDEITIAVKMGGGEAREKVKFAELTPAERKRLCGDFKPASPAEHLARGIRALGTGDVQDASAELSAAKERSLTAPFQAKLNEKQMGAREGAAKSAWEALLHAAGTGKLSEQKAKEISDKLSAFEQEHGATTFAASIAADLAALKDRLAASGGKTLSLDLAPNVKLEMVLIPAGKFTMGSPAAEAKRTESETLHPVTLTRPFYMGKYPITQLQYEVVMAKNPSTTKAANNPVDMVSWNDAEDFCAKLSKKFGKTVRLPTEAEWEYACRAGSTTAYYFGDSETALGDYGWFKDNSEEKPGEKKGFIVKMTHPVGLKKPNAWGLYDMHGNVCQWCQDWFEKYTEDAAIDPQGPARGERRMLRGGSVNLVAGDCRSAFRIGYPPERVGGHVGGFGFRVVVEAASPKTQ